MATTESERVELYELAEQGIGDRFAELMMRSLPPDPDDLACRSDVERVVGAAKSELRIGMRGLTVGQTRTLTLGMVGSVTALTIGQLVVTLAVR